MTARDLVVVAAIAVAGLALYAAIAVARDRVRIDRLQARVACLEAPHGESSIAGRMVGGHFVATARPTRTGCAR